MDHVQATELFSSYWDEDLAPEELKALEEHLRSCVVCRREYKQFQATVDSVHSLHRHPAPQSFAEGVKKRIRSRSRDRFFRPRKLAERIPWELFSLVMLGLLLAVYVVFQLGHPGKLHLP